MTGESTTNAATLPIPSHSSARQPPLANPAPIRLNVSACDELVGNPKYQVNRFHKMADIRVAAITLLSTRRGSISPVPIVLATRRWNTPKATKLKNAAQTTAAPGLSTRVDTTVAMELAASWMPLVKSNSRARPVKNKTTQGSDK